MRKVKEIIVTITEMKIGVDDIMQSVPDIYFQDKRGCRGKINGTEFRKREV